MRAKALSSLILIAALGGCEPTTTQPSPSGWNVVLTGQGSFSGVRGTAGVASQFGTTQALVEVFGPAGAVFAWRLTRGSCAAPGTGVGPAERYPELRISEQGRAAAEAQLNLMLDPNGEYALVLRTGTGEVAACGELQAQRFSGMIPAANTPAPGAPVASSGEGHSAA